MVYLHLLRRLQIQKSAQYIKKKKKIKKNAGKCGLNLLTGKIYLIMSMKKSCSLKNRDHS